MHPGLFRVLACRNARTYVDVLDALELESTQRQEGMSREEALASTKVVLISTLLIAGMLGLVDFILFKLVDWLF